MKHHTIENKPEFVNGELIAIDMNCFGFPPEIRIGKVVRKSFTHIIDTWLVEFKNNFGPTYPFNVLGVPHTFILNRSVTDEEFHAFNL